MEYGRRRIRYGGNGRRRTMAEAAFFAINVDTVASGPPLLFVIVVEKPKNNPSPSKNKFPVRSETMLKLC